MSPYLPGVHPANLKSQADTENTPSRKIIQINESKKTPVQQSSTPLFSKEERGKPSIKERKVVEKPSPQSRDESPPKSRDRQEKTGEKHTNNKVEMGNQNQRHKERKKSPEKAIIEKKDDIAHVFEELDKEIGKLASYSQRVDEENNVIKSYNNLLDQYRQVNFYMYIKRRN